jgi:acyl-CoA synthetase (NDP forming)
MTAPILAKAREGRRTLLTEIEAKDLLRHAGIPVNDTRLAASSAAAVQLAEEMGYPAALKVVSSKIIHKSDIGGVKLGLNSDEEVTSAYDEIVRAAKSAAPDAAIDGVSVQTMASPGTEVIVGITTDPQFGPVLMFGLGGVFVEVLRDVAFRVVPLEPRDARQMVREIQGWPLLEGYRGQDPADVIAIEEILLNLSAFIEQHPEISELDLNPVIVYSKGAVAVDARVLLAEEHEQA